MYQTEWDTASCSYDEKLDNHNILGMHFTLEYQLMMWFTIGPELSAYSYASL
jgi:hypothetical protein